MPDRGPLMPIAAEELQQILNDTSRPVLYANARIRTADPVIGTVAEGDLLLGGPLIVGVGPGLQTAVEDDDAFVVDCAGFEIVPVVTDSLAVAQRRSNPTEVDGALRPGNPATFGILPRPRESDAPATLDLPHDFVAVIENGAPLAWNGVWLSPAPDQPAPTRDTEPPADDARVGVWVDETGFLEQELAADGRYDETRGGRPHAYGGAYWIDGDRVDYLDDLGFWAFGKFDGDVLEHAGYRLRLRAPDSA